MLILKSDSLKLRPEPRDKQHDSTSINKAPFARCPLLPQLCPRSNGPAHLWRLFRRDLPSVRNSAGIIGRPGHGI